MIHLHFFKTRRWGRSNECGHISGHHESIYGLLCISTCSTEYDHENAEVKKQGWFHITCCFTFSPAKWLRNQEWQVVKNRTCIPPLFFFTFGLLNATIWDPFRENSFIDFSTFMLNELLLHNSGKCSNGWILRHVLSPVLFEDVERRIRLLFKNRKGRTIWFSGGGGIEVGVG